VEVAVGDVFLSVYLSVCTFTYLRNHTSNLTNTRRVFHTRGAGMKSDIYGCFVGIDGEWLRGRAVGEGGMLRMSDRTGCQRR